MVDSGRLPTLVGVSELRLARRRPYRVTSRMSFYLTLATTAAALLSGAQLDAQAESRADDAPLTVMAAASLADVLPAIGQAWRQSGGGPVRFSFDATSRLARQIDRGAPADLFVAADRSWMTWLAERGHVLEDTESVLAGNRLVYVVPAGSATVPGSAADLLEVLPARLALAGEEVPAGRYAHSALRALAVWEALESRVVRGGSVRGALEWLVRGEVDGAIVYASDAAQEPRARVAFVIDPSTHPDVEYPAAVLARSPSPAAASAFLDFARTPPAQANFAALGFQVGVDGGGSVAAHADSVGAPQSGHVSGPRPSSAIGISLLVALIAAILGLAPAIAVGWVLARRDFAGKSVVSMLVLAPLVLPPVVTGFLLLSLLGSQGLLGGALSAAGISIPFSLLGAVVAAGVVGFPLYVVAVRGAFETVDPHFEEVSWTLGVPPRRTFARVSLPLALPGIAAGAVLAFARALGEFGATVVLAGNVEGETRTIALAVYTLLESPSGYSETWTLVGASVVMSFAALLGYEALSRRQRSRWEQHGN